MKLTKVCCSLLFFAVFASMGWSCSRLAPENPTLFYKDAEKVFVGVATKSEVVGEPIISGFGRDTLNVVTIEVERVYKGEVPKNIVLHEEYNFGSGCGDDGIGTGKYLFFVKKSTLGKDWGDLKAEEKFDHSFLSLSIEFHGRDGWEKKFWNKFQDRYGKGKVLMY